MYLSGMQTCSDNDNIDSVRTVIFFDSEDKILLRNR